jgi:hypothetical protein
MRKHPKTSRYNVARRIANVFSIEKQASLHPDFDQFKERVDHIIERQGVVNRRTLQDIENAALTFFQHAGKGYEAAVFDLSSDKVLKVYLRNVETARGEYALFSDPVLSDITPDVYGYDEHWTWLIVEKVDVLNGWDAIEERLPSLYKIADTRSEPTMNTRFSKAIRNADSYRDDISPEAYQWAKDVVKLHDRIGTKVNDMKPENTGIDTSGNIVIIDIYLEGLIN